MITDGKWYSNEGSFVVLARLDEDFLIADFDQSNRPDDEVVSNIALTVAAPELLAACKKARKDIYEAINKRPVQLSHTWHDLEVVIELAEKTI